MPHLIASPTSGTAWWISARQCSRIGRANGAAWAIFSSMRGSRSIRPPPSIGQQQYRCLYEAFDFLHERGGVVAVDHAMVAADRKVHQLALLDALAADPVGHEHR